MTCSLPTTLPEFSGFGGNQGTEQLNCALAASVLYFGCLCPQSSIEIAPPYDRPRCRLQRGVNLRETLPRLCIRRSFLQTSPVHVAPVLFLLLEHCPLLLSSFSCKYVAAAIGINSLGVEGYCSIGLCFAMIQSCNHTRLWRRGIATPRPIHAHVSLLLSVFHLSNPLWHQYCIQMRAQAAVLSY